MNDDVALDAEGVAIKVGDDVTMVATGMRLGVVRKIKPTPDGTVVLEFKGEGSLNGSVKARDVVKVVRLHQRATKTHRATDSLGHVIKDGSHVVDVNGVNGVVEFALGVPDGPWLSGRSAASLAGLVVDWEDGRRTFSKARTVTVLGSARAVSR